MKDIEDVSLLEIMEEVKAIQGELIFGSCGR